jgi:hypothetical protein
MSLARFGLPAETLDDLVVVDLDRKPLARPAETVQ